jgi:hypothetical protein
MDKTRAVTCVWADFPDWSVGEAGDYNGPPREVNRMVTFFTVRA